MRCLAEQDATHLLVHFDRVAVFVHHVEHGSQTELVGVFERRDGKQSAQSSTARSRSYEQPRQYPNLRLCHACSAYEHRGCRIVVWFADRGMSLLSDDRGAPNDAGLRAALRGWSYNKGRRSAGGSPPIDLAGAVRWLESSSVDLALLMEPEVIRKTLDALALRIDGRAAAASTVHRKKAILSGALRYGVETERLPAHPFGKVRWEAPKLSGEVDRRAVVNQAQGHRLLAAVRQTTPELEALFATMYFAGLRPEESLNLMATEYERPKATGEWGWLHLTGAVVEAGARWTDTGDTIEERGL
jgi:hypothetical protein